MIGRMIMTAKIMMITGIRGKTHLSLACVSVLSI